ncbi:hypothetical protein Acor_72630 [Acrocarpospora corrugata]|uniref:Lipoprotein n=1 Tax=Acrocarpospora corrugata TaxID=35763 RepID=A0A5M3W806_9ACTN|nr:hypothetical protein [Acrocarpospora corrugata]GES05195.1 hypothetical protein Acor_72630 [Acrocarpospora corrugata]
MRLARSCLTGLLAAVAAAGCSAGPSLEEAGARLAADGRHVMAWDDWVDESVQITNPATTDVPCGDGKFKRVFTAAAELPTLNPDPDNKLDGATRQIGFSFAERGYLRDVSGPSQADVIPTRTIVWVNKAGLRFSGIISLPSDTRIAAQITGETQCE